MFTCLRCENTWRGRPNGRNNALPAKCPQCKSALWNTPRRYARGGKPAVASRHKGNFTPAKHPLTALDLCCGSGGASVGLHRAGFNVVGVDIAPQSRYPFPCILANALDIDFHGFDLIWASPPCQAHSPLRFVTGIEYEDFIEPIRKKLTANGKPYIIENVPGAPLRNPVMLCGTQFGLRVFRHRIFESNLPLTPPAHHPHPYTIGSHRGSNRGEFITVTGNNFQVRQAKEAMGIAWMHADGLAQAIPPAYSEYLARQVIHLKLSNSTDL